jgi:23S rRNA (uridine2552-2'-O)-methyltransferase
LEMAFQCAEKLLKTNGVFVAKLFPSNDTDVLVKSIRPCFTSFSREVLKSTRKSSKEFYLVGRGFKGPRS